MAGYSITKDDYLKRLRRIEGQVRGLQTMVEDENYCIDVLTQISSVTKALQGVASGCCTSTCATACAMPPSRAMPPATPKSTRPSPPSTVCCEPDPSSL